MASTMFMRDDRSPRRMTNAVSPAQASQVVSWDDIVLSAVCKHPFDDQASKAHLLCSEVLNVVKKAFKPPQGSYGVPVLMHSLAVEALLWLQEALGNT
jgi:hypothetical protein